MNFDEVINRRRSESYKWREYPEEVLPLFVADMDFHSPEPVARALGAYIDEGVFGYPRGLHSHDRAQVHELAGLVADRMAHRYKWRIAEICLSANVTICSDEIHSDLLLDRHQHIPIATLDPEIASHTVTLISPSKTFNLAGLQCAFAIIPNSELRQQFRSAREGLVPWVNAMGLIGAEAAYRYGQPWLDELLPYLQANRDFLSDFINRELPGIRMCKPEATYLAWLDCRGLKLGDPFDFFLNHARVALNDGRSFGTGGTGFVRLNFGCPRSTLEEALTRMKLSLTGI